MSHLSKKLFGIAKQSNAKIRELESNKMNCQNKSKEQNKKWGILFGNALNVKTHKLITKKENKNYFKDI